MDERPDTVTIPTELERADAFFDSAILMTTVLVAYWAVSVRGIPWPWLIAPVLLVGLWSLTGEPATDIKITGAIASGLRSKLGMRRAHEWILAWGHYVRVKLYPEWRTRCEAYYKSARRRITR